MTKDPRQEAYEQQRADRREVLAYWLDERELPGTPRTAVPASPFVGMARASDAILGALP